MATSNALLACFLIIIASFCLPTAKSDYNILTLVWPGADCGHPVWFCCRPTAYEQPKLDFFVQTLKSYDTTTGGLLTNCSTCTFYVNQLRDLIEDLNYYWPDVTCPGKNNKAQWQSNWCAYGLCSNLTEPNYFRRALELRKNIDPLFILGEFDIVPSDTKKYRLEDIENALLPSLGFSFYIECRSRHWRFMFDIQLYKIHICVSADAQRLISCPFTRSAINCYNPQIYFAPFTDNMLHGVSVNDMITTAGEAAMLM